MLTYGNDLFRVIIDLEPGVYTAQCSSATGKTWLKKKLLEFSGYGVNVAVLDDKIREVHRHPEVVMVDRFDAFPVPTKTLKMLAQDAVVIVDAKHGIPGILMRTVFFKIDWGRIVVCDSSL